MSGPQHLWLRRLGWLILLWAGGVLAVASTALIARLLMTAVGMAS
jgi:hypothetical protein